MQSFQNNFLLCRAASAERSQRGTNKCFRAAPGRLWAGVPGRPTPNGQVGLKQV